MADFVLIGVSGKKQSGKSLLCDNIYDKYAIEGADITMYSFAQVLKRNVCIDVLGLTNEQCNGTDEQKNLETIYTWDNLPEEVRLKNTNAWFVDGLGIITQEEWDEKYGRECFFDKSVPALRIGQMTAREIMQVVGTDIFRQYFDDNIWVNATLRQINKDKPKIALISDVRFPSEVDAVINSGGYIVRLLRDVCKADPHESETALDNYDFVSWGSRVCIVNNQKMSVEEKNHIVINYLNKIITDVGRRDDELT